MEKLGADYLKPEEKEVFLLMGNKLISKCLGYNYSYVGKDGKPALMYEIEVYAPKISRMAETQEELESVVYNEQTINEIRRFYAELNSASEFPTAPALYTRWKTCFKKLVFCELSKLG